MDLAKVEEELKRLVGSLDKAARLETVVEEEETFRVILSKGNHSDRLTLDKERVREFLESGKSGQEVKKSIGKVISKLNRAAQKRG